MEVSGRVAINLSQLCDVCQSDSASGLCEDCKEYMCKICFQDHKKAKPCRHHVMAPLQQAVGPVSSKSYDERCKIHTTENIRYYCRNHDVVGCGDCIVFKHNECKVDMIKDLAVNFEDSTEFKEMLWRLQKCEVDNNENYTRVVYNIQQNKEFLDKALDGIRKFRKEINNYIDQIEKTVIEDANKHSVDNENMFSLLEEQIALVVVEIDEIREKLDTNIHQRDSLFIRTIECKRRATEVQHHVAEIKSRNILKTYMFKPEQKLKAMIRSNIRLGTVQLSDSNQVIEEISEKVNNVKQKSVATNTPKQTNTCTPKQPLAQKKYSPPDPRSAGYEVGKRVKVSMYCGTFTGQGTGRGTIISIDPEGLVEVKWDQGRTSREKAGYGGQYWVDLL